MIEFIVSMVKKGGGPVDVYDHIRTLAERDELGHAFLITGPDPAEREKLGQLCARALLCEGTGKKPCGVCPACRKTAQGIHPDLIRLERLPDPKNPKEKVREFRVGQVRDLSREAYVLPNEGKRKVFLLPEADTMNPSAQNALLKLLEEPPAYAAFLLLGGNPGAFLPTVRSRCVALRAGGSTSAGGDPEAAKLAEAWIGRDGPALAALCFRAEKLDRGRFDQLLEGLYAAAGLRAKAGGSGRERALALAELAEKLRSMRKYNVSPGLCMGLLLSTIKD